jgi:hypothetical protein
LSSFAEGGGPAFSSKTQESNMADTEKKSSPLLIAAAWAIVIIPTAWGLNYTVQNAMKIFTKATPPATTSSLR